LFGLSRRLIRLPRRLRKLARLLASLTRSDGDYYSGFFIWYCRLKVAVSGPL
jgi:hypothetical protein